MCVFLRELRSQKSSHLGLLFSVIHKNLVLPTFRVIQSQILLHTFEYSKCFFNSFFMNNLCIMMMQQMVANKHDFKTLLLMEAVMELQRSTQVITMSFMVWMLLFLHFCLFLFFGSRHVSLMIFAFVFVRF